jgi:hypothetical protein
MVKIKVEGGFCLPSIAKEVDKLLSHVAKPPRYLGNEWNTVKKDHAQVDSQGIAGFSRCV